MWCGNCYLPIVGQVCYFVCVVVAVAALATVEVEDLCIYFLLGQVHLSKVTYEEAVLPQNC